MRFIYRGRRHPLPAIRRLRQVGERAGADRDPDIPLDVTHVFIDGSIDAVPEGAFREHPNIEEVFFHDNVERIEDYAFTCCPRLKKVVMPGVKSTGRYTFGGCLHLTDVQCDKLGFIDDSTFFECRSLRSINLPSAETVECDAFMTCTLLTSVKFGSKLDSIEGGAFNDCHFLERITIPLRGDMFWCDSLLDGCKHFKHVHLVEEAALRETIAALHLEEWRNDMIAELDSIDAQILNTKEDKAGAIRNWMRQLLLKIEDYTTQHRHVLNEAATILGLALWETSISECHNVIESVPTRAECRVLCGAEIVIKNVLPFLDLPPHTFEVCTDYDDEDDGWA